jgi:hypothetical protein
MFAYRTPGVYFEWQDLQAPAIGRRRTDVAGFVGIAASGPLHHPVKSESWTQFVSTFGEHIAQGYLAYAVEGFFDNGGQSCWVVRVADPQTARPASLDLLDDACQPALRLTAHNNTLAMPSPGVWGNAVTVSVTRGSHNRFSLRLGLPNGRQEFWPNLTMEKPPELTRRESAFPRYVEAVLNDSVNGSRLVKAKDLNSLAMVRTPSLLARTRLRGGRDGLAPSADLTDEAGRPTLRLAASGSRPYDEHIWVSVEPGTENTFTLIIEPGRERFEKLSMDPKAVTYVEAVLNDPRTGSRLVVAQNLRPPSQSTRQDPCSPDEVPHHPPARVTTRLTRLGPGRVGSHRPGSHRCRAGHHVYARIQTPPQRTRSQL